RAEVRERDAPNLGVILRGHDHFDGGRDRAVAPGDFCSILRERHVITIRLNSARLVTDRPALATPDVAQEHVRPPDVARDVLTPAGDRQPTPSRSEEHTSELQSR